MRIGIEAQRLFRPDKHGMEIVTQELIRQLQVIDKENEYTIYVREDTDPTITETDNFRIRHLKGTFPVWEQFSLPRAARNDRLDFIHCTSNTGPLNTRLPVMLTLHDIIYLEQIGFKGSAYQNFGNLYRRAIVPGLLKRCKFILTVSEYEKQVIAGKLPFAADQVHVVYNGVNPAFRKLTDQVLLQQIRSRYSLPEKYYLFFGNTAPKKNTDRLVMAYAAAFLENQALPALVITDYQAELVRKLLHEPKYKPVLNTILTLGHIPHEEMPALYTMARIFLYPSLRESFGMPVLEAMACGTPVITSSSSSMPEVAGGAALLVDPMDTSALTAAILELEASGSLMQKLISAGLERSKLFSWENTARSVLEYYKKM